MFDPQDPGGETNFGICKKSYPELDIKNLTKEQAITIYKRDYWDKLHCDGYTNVRFRWKLFDIAVNQGVGTAMSFRSKIKHPDKLEGIFELIELQVRRYISLIIKNPKLFVFINGWINRAFDTGEDL